MAFSPTDEARLFDRMGYARRYLSVDSSLVQAINAVGDDAQISALIVSYLDRCDEIDAKLKGAEGRQAIASIDKQDVVFSGPREIIMLRSQGRLYLGRIARLLKVVPVGDGFSSSIQADNRIKYG